jgi:hypothetical protein
VLRNGLYLVADEAARRSGDPLVMRYRQALVLGSLREDVLFIPGFGPTEYPSFRHFGGRGLPGGYLPLVWPGPKRTADTCYRRALGFAAKGKTAEAFVSLGRILHILTDACIPSHAHRVAHGYDPFEWHVEGHLPQLRELPVPAVPLAPRPSALVVRVVREAARHRPDRTNTPIGRLLRRANLARKVDATEARTQVEALLPLAIGHGAALLRMFMRDKQAAAPRVARA